MIIGVSGGTGFIGKRLVSLLLSKGYKVRMLSRRAKCQVLEDSNLEVFECDLLTANQDELTQFFCGVEVFIHCAAEITDANIMQALHVDAVQKLIEAASGKIRRWVQLSSVGVYGPQAHGVITESTSFMPLGAYEITKAKSEKLVTSYAKENAFEVVTLRPSNVFGEEMTNASLFGLIGMIKKGCFFFIGAQGANANYIHVANVAEALVLCATHKNAAGKTYNISDSVTLEFFVGQIAKSLKCTAPKVRIPELLIRLCCRLIRRLVNLPLTEARIDALTSRAVYSIERIKVDLDYRHKVGMVEGIEKLVRAGRQRHLF